MATPTAARRCPTSARYSASTVMRCLLRPFPQQQGLGGRGRERWGSESVMLRAEVILCLDKAWVGKARDRSTSVSTRPGWGWGGGGVAV
eukprot:279297-Chlamydomonas_euryale.AAC.11